MYVVHLCDSSAASVQSHLLTNFMNDFISLTRRFAFIYLFFHLDPTDDRLSL